MTINDTLFKAILAMDSYNRGYDRAIQIDTVPNLTQIGNATIIKQSDIDAGTSGVNIGFYALAYGMDTNGDGIIGVSDERIISYRGTDKNALGGDSGSDMLNGYGVSLDSPTGAQARMAFEFYNSVASQINNSAWIDPRVVKIDVTGHSLGGGLAGLVGAMYGQEGALFDNMAFEDAARYVQTAAYVSTDYRDLVYGDAPATWGTSITSDPSSFLQTYSTYGEFLGIINRNTQDTPETVYNLGHENYWIDDVSLSNLPIAENFARHSMATLTIRLFAETEIGDIKDWQNSAVYFWPVLYDDGFAQSIGMHDSSVSGVSQTKEQYAAILRTILAYSAIPQEFDGDGKETSVTIFGDTGIRTLYDDANELGAAITAAGAGSTITEYATEISESFVQYAGQLALSKINQGDDTSRDETQGVLHYDPLAGDTTLTIDFSDALWTAAGKGTLPNMVARANLVGDIWADTGADAEIRSAALEMWNNGTTNVIDHVVFAISGGTYDLPETLSTADSATLFVGSSDDDVIKGAAGNHIISGAAGNDTLDYSQYDSAVTAEFYGNGSVKITGGAGDTALKDFAVGVENYVLTELGDTLKINDSSLLSDVNIDAGGGHNHLDFTGLDTGVVVNVGSGFTNFDVFTGSGYGDSFVDGAGEQVYEGGGGLDTLDYSNAGAPIIVNTTGHLLNNTFVYDGVETRVSSNSGWVADQASGFEKFIGAGGDDYFYANAEGVAGASYTGGGNSSFSNALGTVFYGRDIVDFSDYAANNADTGITVTMTGLGSGYGTDGQGGTFTLSGIEQIIGTDGVDTLIGDGDSNWLFGGRGYDTLEGRGGDDHLIGTFGANILDGGSGNDTYYFTFEQGDTFSANITDLSGTNDKIYMMQDYKMERLDTFTPYAGAGIEYIENSDGSLFEMAGMNLQFTQDLIAANITGVTTYGDLTNNTLDGTVGNDTIGGGDGADKITGGAGSDYLDGDAGDDDIDGGGDDDIISGGGGDDILMGGAGNDLLEGEAGSDDLSGGDGDDELYANSHLNNAEDQDIDGLNGGAGNDILHGSGGGDILTGGEGYDYLYGKTDDALFGDGGQDMLLSTGDNAYLDGGDGNDYLEGNGANTTFVASAGDDVIRAAGVNSTLLIEGEALQNLQFGLASNGSYIITKSDGDHIILPLGIDYISFAQGDPGIAFSTILDQRNFTYRSSLVQDTSDQHDMGTFYSYLPQDYIGGDEDNIYYCYADGDTVYSGGGTNFYIFDTAYDPGNKTTISSSIDAEQDIIRLDGISSLDDVQLVFDFGIGSLHFGHSEVVILNALEDGASDQYLIALDSIDPNADPGSIALYTLSDVHHIIKHAGGGDLNGYSADDEIFVFGLGGASTYGYTGNDTIHGSIVADVIYGGDGNDTLDGNEGSDEIYGDNGNDTINGGEGNDTLYGGSGDDTIHGGYGADIIFGGDGSDVLDGNSGNDEIDGQSGLDLYIDSLGDDIYHARTDDTLLVGQGDNVVVFEETDMSGFTIDLSDYVATDGTYQFTRDFSINSNSDYKITYGDNSLTLLDYNQLSVAPSVYLGVGQLYLLSDLVIAGYGSNQADTYSESGFISQNDLVYAGGGDDNFTFMNGNDIFYGGDGNDNASKVFGFSFTLPDGTVIGSPSGTGSLTAYGEGGDDFLQGGIGNDTLDGGDGNDNLFDLYGGTDTLNGGNGDDLFALDSDGGDTIDGGAGTDTLFFGAANTVANIYGTPTSSFEIDLTQGTATASQGGVHNFINIENVVGSELNDTIIGDNGVNELTGSQGDDLLEGGLGSDTYYFGDAEINPTYDDGNDIITDIGGAADTVGFAKSAELEDFSFTTSGNDLVIGYTNGTVTISNYYTSSAYEIENIQFADSTTLNLSDWPLWNLGTDGADTITADETQNVVYSGAGDDQLFADQIGSILYAGSGTDILTGNIGNDILSGGAGDDILSGGSGDDIYLFAAGDGYDTITDTLGYDILSIAGDIDLSNLVFSRVGDALHIEIASGVTITDFYSGNHDALLEEIQFSDGSSFDLTSLLDPTAQSDIFTADQDTVITGNLLADNGNGTDSDPDGGILSVVAGTFATENGSVTIAANGDFTYTPTAGYAGLDSFTYELEDGQGGSDTGIVSITLTSINLAPTAVDDAFTGPQDTSIIGNVLVDNGNGADSDTDGGILSVVAGTFGTTHGSVTLASNGDFTYTPDAGYVGADSFDYTLEDGQGGSDIGNVNLGINEVVTPNTPPIAADDAFAGNEDVVITGNLLTDNGNGADSDADLDTLSVTAGTFATTNGSVTIAANGDFTYTPDGNYNGADSFTYTVLDGQGGSDTATATLSINAVNDAPIAVDDTFAGNQDTAIAGNVLLGSGIDSDVDGDTLNVVAGTFATSQGGSVNILTDGSFVYTPVSGYFGADSFDYTLQDGHGGTDIGSANLTINEVTQPNTNPVASDDSFSSNEDVVIIGNVMVDNGNGADSDADLDTLSVTAGTFATAHGSVTLAANGDFTYTPNTNYNGADSFSYTLSDGNGGSDTAMVSLTLNPVNDAPIANDDGFIGNQDANISGNLLVNNGAGIDSDIDGDALSVVAGTYATAHGSVVISSNGDFLYSPTAGYYGADSFSYTLSDGNGASDIGDVSLSINAASSGDIYGTSGNDNMTGTAGDDVIHGLAGYDFISGETGNDILYGDEDGDTLKGRDGNDILYGGDGIDYLEGNAGNDILYGGLGADSLKGSADVDTFVYLSSHEGGDVIFDFSPGSGEKIDLTGVLSNAVGFVDTQAFTDGFLHTQQNGSDVDLYLDMDGNSGSGNEILFITLQNLNVSDITLNAFILPSSGAQTNYAPIASDDTFTGHQGYSITGNLLADNGNGKDSDANGDILFVTDETITSAHGSAVISANGDFIYTPTVGYVGADSFSYSVHDGNGGDDIGLVNLTLTTTTSSYGTSGNDTMSGTAGDDVIYGLDGSDFLSGGDGNDIIYGGLGDDTLKGREGDDILYGGAGNDYLEGNGGHDLLYGGLGIDLLKGGVDIDTFVFDSMDGIGDTIQDFRPEDGDAIDISDLLTGYNPLTDVITNFVQITDNGTDSYLAVDIDGGADNFVQVATILAYVGLTDEKSLETGGSLITA